MSGEKPPAGADLDDDLKKGLTPARHDPAPHDAPPPAEAPLQPEGSPGAPGTQPKGEQAPDDEDDLPPGTMIII
jgi:hypothetical protein